MAFYGPFYGPKVTVDLCLLVRILLTDGPILKTICGMITVVFCLQAPARKHVLTFSKRREHCNWQR